MPCINIYENTDQYTNQNNDPCIKIQAFHPVAPEAARVYCTAAGAEWHVANHGRAAGVQGVPHRGRR